MATKKEKNPVTQASPLAGMGLEELTREAASVAPLSVRDVQPESAPSTEKVPDIKQTSGNEWKDFLEYAQEYKESDKESIQVWLDADVKYTLDAIRQAGIKIPVKHLLSAAVRVFIESNAGEVKALLEKKPRIIV